MYTFKEATERIRATGGEATYEQLRHWAGLGLLQVVEGESRGGRPPKMLTEEGLGAATSLSRWYRIVRNPEAAKILLWLEGFDYVDVDPMKTVQRLRNELHEDLRRKIPSLPPFEEIDPDSPLIDRLLAEVDENFTRRGSANLGGLIPLMFGMIRNPEDFDLEQRYGGLFGGEIKDPLPSALDMLMATQSETLKETPEIRSYLGEGTADNPVALREFGMALVQGNLEEVDWEFVRALWRVFNLAADVAYELWATGQHKDQEVIKILVNLRYAVYTEERNGPGGVLTMLLPLSLVIPEGYKQEYKQMVTLLSQARKAPPQGP